MDDRQLVTDTRAAGTAPVPYLSWASIVAGAVVAAAISLALFALGAGLGLSSISPWQGSGVSAGTFKVASGVYVVCVAVMSSAIGGYLAARLRSRWVELDSNEIFFRDTAHGLVSWAAATILSAAALGAATTHIVSGAASGLTSSASQTAAAAVNPVQIYVDRLFRSDQVPATPTSPDNSQPVRAEVLRLWTSDFQNSNELSAPDRAYVARLVAAQTGMSQPDAERRVAEVINEAKSAADTARKGAAKLAFWMAAALLFGAFAASLAAVEGGQLRDGTWRGRRLTPRAL